MVPAIDPKVDIVFKRLFGTEANADLPPKFHRRPQEAERPRALVLLPEVR